MRVVLLRKTQELENFGFTTRQFPLGKSVILPLRQFESSAQK